MNVSSVALSFTGSSSTISISANNKYNKHKPFLYNEILEILKENYFPSTSNSSKFNINIDDTKFQAQKMNNLIKELNKRGIKFRVMA